VETDVRRGRSDDPESPTQAEDGTGVAARAQGWLNRWGKQSTSITMCMQGNCFRTEIATVDNTLSLLHTSAVSGGVAHKLTRNLHSVYERPSGPWRPTGEPVHPKPKKRQTGRYESGELAWNIIGETVRMAEGHGKLMLGRVPPRQRKTCRNLK